MIALLPRTAGASAAAGRPRSEVRVLGRQQVWTSLILMLMLMIGQFVPFTYIAPLLQEVTGLDAGLVPWVLLLNGVGATLGVFIGGKLADWQLMPSLIAMLALQAVGAGRHVCRQPLPAAHGGGVTVWGGLNFAIGTPIQTRILGWTADAPNLASSLIPSGFNVGIALAAFVGAMMLNGGFGYRSLPVLGIAAMIVAAAVALASYIAEQRSGAMPPQAAPAAG